MFNFNVIIKVIKQRISGKLISSVFIITATVYAFLVFSGSPPTAQSAQPERHNTAKEGNQLIAQLPDVPASFIVGGVVSAPRPLRGQKRRSSGNFNVISNSRKLRWEVVEGDAYNNEIVFEEIFRL